MSCGQTGVASRSGYRFSEYLYDQGKPLAAAEVCQKRLDAMDPRRFDAGGESDSVMQCRAKMNYFRACHWLEQKDPVKQLYYLERALQADPGEVDALIACYRLPNPTPAFRARIVKLIQERTAQSRAQMAHDPKSPLPCNELAWLVCNTQGDLDEALRASQKSLELSPNNSAFLDTLAHVYFAKGDLQSAVKYQTMAVEREPHSGLLNSELKRFRAALEENAKKGREKPQQ
jgi:tetratricopeptide (TPR) repeat protein